VVGLEPSAGLWIPIPDGEQMRLSDIIGGGGSGGVIADEIYWLCCRDKPGMTNNPSIVPALSLNDASGGVHVLSGDIGPSVSGLTPSQVKRTGRWI
jgi:hypothetical protein